MPTEYVLDVMRWVLFRTDDLDDDGGGPDRDGRRVVELLSTGEPELRALIEHVADATVRDEPLRLRDLADELGRDTGELSDAIDLLNATALEGDRPLFELRQELAVGVQGQTGKIAHIGMRVELARVARHALRREVGQ